MNYMVLQESMLFDTYTVFPEKNILSQTFDVNLKYSTQKRIQGKSVHILFDNSIFSAWTLRRLNKKFRCNIFWSCLTPPSYFIILFILNRASAPQTPEAKFLVPDWAIKSTLAQG